jgi:transcriptional regulator with XRE-family HTH domain
MLCLKPKGALEMQRKQFDTDAPPTRIGKLVSDRMEDRGLSIRDLAAKLDITYEHVRRITRGEGVPSKFVLKAVCEALGLNFKEAEKLATADRIQKKYGDVPLELAGKEPELEPLERVWSELSEEQKRNILSMAQAWARSNRRAAS